MDKKNEVTEGITEEVVNGIDEEDLGDISGGIVPKGMTEEEWELYQAKKRTEEWRLMSKYKK